MKNIKHNLKNVKENIEYEKEKLKNTKKKKMINSIIPSDIWLCLFFGIIIEMLSGDIVKAVVFGCVYGLLGNFFVDFVKNMD